MRGRGRTGRVAASALMLWIQLGSLGVAPVLAQSQATKPPVVRGQEYYEQSRFDEAITLLRELVDRAALSGDDLQKAREILARSYVKKGYPAQAKEMFKAILRTSPDYRPDPIRVPPDETAVFEQALQEYKSEGAAPPAAQPAKQDTVKAAAPPTAAKPVNPAMVVPAATSGKKPLYKQWWVWLAGAAVIGGVAAAAGGGGGGGGGTPDLASFPPPPP